MRLAIMYVLLLHRGSIRLDYTRAAVLMGRFWVFFPRSVKLFPFGLFEAGVVGNRFTALQQILHPLACRWLHDRLRNL